MAKQNYDDEWVKLTLNDRFQRIIRHKEYRAFCDNYPEYFDEDGWEKHSLPNPENVAEGDQEPNLEEYNKMRNDFEVIKDKFGLDSLIHYDRHVAELDLLNLPIFTAHSPVKCTYYRYEEDGALNSTPIHPDNSIHLKIDTSPEYPEDYILNEVRGYIKAARTVAEFKKVINRFMENQTAYKAYDLYIKGASDQTIAFLLGLGSPNTARSKVKRAHELIYDEPLIEDEKLPSDEILASEERWDEISEGPNRQHKLLSLPDQIEEIFGTPESADPVRPLEYQELFNHLKSFCINCITDHKCREEMLKGLDFHNPPPLTPCDKFIQSLNKYLLTGKTT